MIDVTRSTGNGPSRVLIIEGDSMQLRAYVQGIVASLGDEAPAPRCADPRPTKGKFEPAHLFNSRMREWQRRNL